MSGKNIKKSTAKSVSDSKNKSKPKREKKPARTGALDAAALVLKEVGQPLSCGEIMKVMLEKGLWKTNGKTPASTLYSAILREITTKAKQSRFIKTERGKFKIAA